MKKPVFLPKKLLKKILKKRLTCTVNICYSNSTSFEVYFFVPIFMVSKNLWVFAGLYWGRQSLQRANGSTVSCDYDKIQISSGGADNES